VARSTPAVDRAVQYIRSVLAAGGVSRLPPVRVLACQAGVSYVTMVRAVRRLVGEGRLVAVQGRGTVVAGAQAPGAGPAAGERPTRGKVGRPAFWQALAVQVSGDLVEGRFGTGSDLPSLKELARVYHVNHRTLSRALTRLGERGQLVRCGRSYRVPALHSGRGQGCVVLVARGSEAGRQVLFDERTADRLRQLENQCHRAGVALRVLPVVHRNDRLMRSDGARGFGEEEGFAVLGYILSTTGMRGPSVLDLERRLAGYAKPVAVLDEDDLLGGTLSGGAQTALFVSAGSAACGRRVGRFLRGLGHRRAAYFSMFAAEPWSINRLAGLREAFGATGSVREFAAESIDDLVSSAPEVDRMLGALGLPGVAVGDLSMATALAVEQIRRAVRQNKLQQFLAPLFDSALCDDTVTCWVGANDDVALQCLQYLHLRSVEVPERVSVVGFDDTFGATYWELSSFTFDTPTVVHTVLAHVLQPRWHSPGSGQAKSPHEIDGFVVERGTTASPPPGTAGGRRVGALR
jgi:DNA-binding LacI/PurR family transcriptional regulator/DNA-binding transcriptional regulator YhcF (GntR family)